VNLSRLCRSVSALSFVCVPSSFLKVFKCVFSLFLLAANLYTSSQRLIADVNLQNAFQELNFSFCIVDEYQALPSKYYVLRWVLKFSIFVVLWYICIREERLAFYGVLYYFSHGYFFIIIVLYFD